MRLKHPRGLAGITVDVAGEHVMTDADGTFAVPDDARGWAEDYAAANGTTVDALRVTETCDTVKTDGEVCGRELPCPYHSEDA